MTTTLSDLLLQDYCAERTDAYLVELCHGSVVHVQQQILPPIVPVVHFVLDGTIYVEVEKGDSESPLVLCPGECAVLGYGTGHRISIVPDRESLSCETIKLWPKDDQPTPIRVGTGTTAARFISAAVHVPRKLDRQTHLHAFPELVSLKHRPSQPFAVKTLFSDTQYIEANCQGRGSSAFVNAFLSLHLTHYLRVLFNQARCGEAIEAWYTRSRQIEASMRMLRKHPERNWTVADLASEVGHSRSLFAAMFTTYAGTGPMAYLRGVRMELAAQLLRENPELSILRVSRRVGYDRVNSFGRAFKAAFGLYPGEFRETFSRGGDDALSHPTAAQRTTAVRSSHQLA